MPTQVKPGLSTAPARCVERRLPEQDLNHVLAHAAQDLDALRGASVFITGGTGFVGTWLTQSLLWANKELGLDLRVVLLTRSPEAFRSRLPFLADDASLGVLSGDMTTFSYPEGEFPFVIHAATAPHVAATHQLPLASYPLNVDGTLRVLEFARTHGTRRLLFTSSGAVYGRVPSAIQPIGEDCPGAPATWDPRSAYGQGKRTSEWMCTMYSRQFGFDATIARLFAFMGPHLPLDAGFAFGNFLRDAMAGGPVRVRGDGRPKRSYLCAADLAVWLWRILARGQASRPYNVGSPQAMTIAELARAIVAGTGSGAAIDVESEPGVPGHDYVPDVRRAESELGLRSWVTLEEGVRRTCEWYRQVG